MSDPGRPSSLAIWLSLIVGLGVGYLAGREHLEYEMKTAVSEAVEGVRSAFKGKPGSVSDPVIILNDKRCYISEHLDLYGLQHEMNGRVPTITGKIKKTGERTLTRIKVRARFLDDEGRPIFEAHHFPVSANPFLDTKPELKPNYVRAFSFTARDVPSEWNTKRISVGIVDIDFAEREEVE